MTQTASFTGSAGPLQILRPDGTLAGEMPSGLTEQDLVQIYRWMVRLRTYDQRALTLQRQGRMGTYAPYSGQEASQVGSVWPLTRTDWLAPTYRESAAMIVHGAPLLSLLRYWRGDEWGSHYPGVNTLPIAIPIATQCVHAVGLAWAGKLQGTGQVAVGYLGDGATSEGDFHEAMNFAAVFKLPVIFFCQNNGYAISVPVSKQMAAPVAARAAGYGLPGVQVDGMDILAVYQVMSEAVERARSGHGATLVEAFTYRYGPHTTADDPSRYRAAEEAKEWQEQRDPIERLRKLLLARSLWDDGAEAALQEEARAEMAQAVAELEALPRPRVEDIFDHVYTERPWFVEEQRQEALRRIGEGEQNG